MGAWTSNKTGKRREEALPCRSFSGAADVSPADIMIMLYELRGENVSFRRGAGVWWSALYKPLPAI
jgi:hypothetical protein